MRLVVIAVSWVLLLFADLAMAGIWMDDFEREELGEDWVASTRRLDVWTPPPDWRIEEGLLRGYWPNWNYQMLYVNGYDSIDYTVQVRCRIDRVYMMPEFAGAGIIFRSIGLINLPSSYGFAIHKEFARFAITHGLPITFLPAIPEKHEIGRWYTLKLVAAGSNFLAYVDGELLCKLQDGKYKDEFVGLAIGSNIDASFDDFIISDQVDEEAFSKAFGVSPGDMVLATTWADLKVR